MTSAALEVYKTKWLIILRIGLVVFPESLNPILRIVFREECVGLKGRGVH